MERATLADYKQQVAMGLITLKDCMLLFGMDYWLAAIGCKQVEG